MSVYLAVATSPRNDLSDTGNGVELAEEFVWFEGRPGCLQPEPIIRIVIIVAPHALHFRRAG